MEPFPETDSMLDWFTDQLQSLYLRPEEQIQRVVDHFNSLYRIIVYRTVQDKDGRITEDPPAQMEHVSYFRLLKSAIAFGDWKQIQQNHKARQKKEMVVRIILLSCLYLFEYPQLREKTKMIGSQIQIPNSTSKTPFGRCGEMSLTAYISPTTTTKVSYSIDLVPPK